MPRYPIKFSSSFLAVFGVFLRFLFRVRFDRVCIACDQFESGGKTVVVVANHMSWWDGFLIYMLRRHLSVSTPIYTVMLEEQLKQHSWLRQIGCVGIVPGQPATTVSAFSAIAKACRQQPGSWVLYFPQGKIKTSWSRPLEFEHGIEHLLHALEDYVVLPVALHIEPLTKSRPSAFVLASRPDVGTSRHLANGVTATVLEKLVTERLDRLQHYIERMGESVASKWSSVEALIRIGNYGPQSSPDAGGSNSAMVDVAQAIFARKSETNEQSESKLTTKGLTR